MLLPGELGEAPPRQAKKIRMNITLRKIRQINVDDAARKHAQALPVPGIRLPESADAEFTAVRRWALDPFQTFKGAMRPDRPINLPQKTRSAGLGAWVLFDLPVTGKGAAWW